MRPTHVLLTAVALSIGLLACGGQTGPVVSPPVSGAGSGDVIPGFELPSGSDIAPVYPAEETLGMFRLPPGYRIELVAAEPLVHDPVWIHFDPDGRLWVVEMTGYMTNILDQGADEPSGRVVVLEDLNGDGRMDRRTVFMDSLVLPRTVTVLEHGVLIAQPPNLWLARDLTGDLRADTRELVRSDYGDPARNVEHNSNGLFWGIDNWIHNTNYEGQFRLRDGRFEYRHTGTQGQWGISMDEFGRLYRNFNEDPLRMDLISAHYGVRNPNQGAMRGVYERLTPNVPVWPIRPTPGINRGYRERTMRPDSTLAHYTAAGAPTAFVGDRLPAEVRRQVFIPEPVGNLVGRLEVREGADGIPEAVRIDGETDFLGSMDERFRPVFLTNAPDGTLYVADMYRGIIQHRGFITGYLEQQINARGLEFPTGLGRIYRVVHESMPPRQPESLSALQPAQLVQLLSHTNGWHRITAQRLIVERGDRSVAPAVRQVLRTSPDERFRLHALWTLDGLGEVDLGSLRSAMGDRSEHVRAAAVRIAEAWLPEEGHPLAEEVLQLMDDPSRTVRRQVAASIGELAVGQRLPALASLVTRHGDDPIIPDLVVSGLAGHEFAFLQQLLEMQEPARQEANIAATVEALAATLFRTRDMAAIEFFMRVATDTTQPHWLRVAILQAPAGGGGGGPPGPGGPAAVTGPIQLASEPAGLVALMEGTDEALRTRATAFQANLNWPGKPNPPRVVRPLTPEEQQVFAAGERLYEVNCAVCHQADGQGLAGVASALAGSSWVQGGATQAIRIILHGFEGEMLMPPLGQVLSDEAIAAVLTYTRRAWGNTADPVTPEAVAEARGARLGRDRPWTAEELPGR